MRQPILPALQTIGSIYPHTLILELPRFSRVMLENSVAGDRSNEPARVYAHELHHFFDIVGTLWGQRYLDLVFSAFDALLTAKSEDAAYPEAIRLFDADREILFPSYYKYVTPGAPHGTSTRWINRWSAGHRIRPDGTPNLDHPILFVRLETEAAVVARQPLSIGALLELRAMAAEENTFEAFLPTIHKDEQAVERTIRQRELMQHLYDPLLTTYSAAAHVLATASGQGAIGPVFTWGAALADLCLNIDQSMLRGLRPPPVFSDFGHRVLHGFRSRADPGFVYACAIRWLRDKLTVPLDEAALEAALRGVGLPDPAEIYRQAERIMVRRTPLVVKSDRLKPIRAALREAGIVLLRKRSECAGLLPQSAWKELASPTVMTDDCEEFHLGQVTVTVDDANWLHQCEMRFHTTLRQALRAGRGVDFGYSDYVY